MAMYLGECPIFIIMLIGRWSSDAFLMYIRKQVMEFSQNVVKRMLSCQNFRHIPEIHTRVPQDYPCIRNHPDNAETKRNIGGDSHRRISLPPFSRFNWEHSFLSAWSFSIDGGSTLDSWSGIGGGGYQSLNIDLNPACPIGPSLCIFHIHCIFYKGYWGQEMMSSKLLGPTFFWLHVLACWHLPPWLSVESLVQGEVLLGLIGFGCYLVLHFESLCSWFRCSHEKEIKHMLHKQCHRNTSEVEIHIFWM